MMNPVSIGIDLGGTRIKAVTLDGEGKLLYQQYHPTHDGDGARWKNVVAAIMADIAGKISHQDYVIGLSAPGLPSEDNATILSMPGRLEGLENFSWKQWLGREVFVLNDAVAALVAEARFGAAKNKKHAVMLTLGTGVGGAILIDGKPYQGMYNKAGHLGHMVINDEEDPDVTGIPGSLENSIGNCTVAQRSGGKFSTTAALLAACKNGDVFAREIWMKSIRKLAIGLASITNILSPEVIIIGGGIAEAGEDLFDPLEQLLAHYEWRVNGSGVKIVKAQLGDMAGAIGAACFAATRALPAVQLKD